MFIVDRELSKEELRAMAPEYFGDMVKGVADVDRGLLALNAELHADLEAMLLESGSRQEALWGFNLYPDMEDEDFLEFDSLINIRPMQGNRSRGVEDPAVREKIRELIAKWIRE